MRCFQLLGHSNGALSMIIESIKKLNDKKKYVEIYCNIPIEDVTDIKLPFTTEDIEVEEYSSDVYKKKSNCKALIAATGTGTKKAIYEFFSSNYSVSIPDYTQLVDIDAIISSTTQLHHGVIVGPGSITAPYTVIKEFVSINRGVKVGHHTDIGEFSTLNPGCNIGGCVKIGKNVLIGMGAVVIDRLSVGDNTIIGAGSVVTKSIPPNVVAYGVPAKVIRNIT